MKLFKRMMRRIQTRQKPRYSDVQQLTNHTRRDLGIDSMAVEYQRDSRLWQQLAA